MLRSYSGWVAIVSYVCFHILAFVKCIKNIPGDITFVVNEMILLITFYVGTIICCLGDK